MITLKDLSPGESGVITGIHIKGLMKRRLIDMGVTEGARVKKLRSAPLGDPSEYLIMGYNLGLRSSEASQIEIIKGGEDIG
ncbi:MAG: FeoA family protein [Monoglobales bacterium]|mgnify:FL=1